MTRVCRIFLIFLGAAAVSGCIVIKNPFQDAGATARAPAGAASESGEVRRAPARTGAAEKDERELLMHAVKTLAQTRRIGRAASRNRIPGAPVVFDYTYFDHDLQEMIKAVREYLAVRASDGRATPPLKLDYAR